MDTAGQLPVFIVCAAAGIGMGALYDVLSPFRFGKVSTAIADVVFWLLSATGYITLATACEFPDFRLFSYVALAIGAIIYSKSLRRVVAFFQKVCYNRGVKLKNAVVLSFFNRKKGEKTRRGRKKEEKNLL